MMADNSSVLLNTELSLPMFVKGKVRDSYDLGDKLLIVATDRISAFDVVLPCGITNKGKVLNKLSAFWFDQTREFMPNGQIGKLYEGQFTKTKPAEATTLSTYKNGLRYKYFEPGEEIDHSGALDTIEPKSAGTIAHIT